MSYTFELNNERRDADYTNGMLNKKSPVVEIFSAMRDGKEISSVHLSKAGDADKCAKYIMALSDKASKNDMRAVSELNEIRRISMEPTIIQEIKLLSIFGNYTKIGYNESCEVEIPVYTNIKPERQALKQDVTFPVIRKKRVPIATTTISGGYAVDYRKAAFGDMTDENELKDQVCVQIRNNATKYVVETVYNSVKDATGIKYFFEGDGLTKTGVDGVITSIRRHGGRPTIAGDYSLVSQFNGFVGYEGVTPKVQGIPDSIMEEINRTGLIGMYNGSVVTEITNPYNLYELNDDKTDFETLLPAGLGFVMPTGVNSPIHTATRGGLTSFSGNSVTTGDILSRFDLEVGAIVAPGREYTIGLIHDKRLDDLAE